MESGGSGGGVGWQWGWSRVAVGMESGRLHSAGQLLPNQRLIMLPGVLCGTSTRMGTAQPDTAVWLRGSEGEPTLVTSGQPPATCVPNVS